MDWDETMDRLTEELQELFKNDQINLRKREKLIMSLERRNRNLRQSIDPADQPRHRKLKGNIHLIRRMRSEIKKAHLERQRNRIRELQTESESHSLVPIAIGVIIVLCLVAFRMRRTI
jgi:hypothetical protein